MKLGDLTQLAARNLRESAVRNLLTTLGIAVGVASFVAMLSLGIGLQELVNRRLERNGLFDSVLVRPRTAFAGLGQGRQNQRLGGERTREADTPNVPLDQQARQRLTQLPNVTEVYPEFRFTGDLRLGQGGRLAQVASLPPSASSSDGLEGMQGHFFSSASAHEVILQMDVADDLAESQHMQSSDLVGKDVVLRYAGRQPLPPDSAQPDSRDQGTSPDEAALGFSIISSQVPLRVVGIVDAEAIASGASAFARSGAYIPLAIAEELGVVQGNDMGEIIRNSNGEGGQHYASLTVRVQNPANVPAVEEAVTKMGYTAFSLLDLTRNLRRLFAVLDLLLGIFGSLALAVASLGIINTLVMAILERRREIGVLKALGASDRDVRRLFFAEASVMGLAGGVVGVGLGWAIGRVIQFATDYYLRQQNIPPENIWTVPLWLVAAAIAFSVVVSLIAGIYPATRAAKLDPVEALRYE